MPGVTAIVGDADEERAAPALEAVRFFDRYARTDHVSTDSTLVAHTGYDAYPVRSFEFDGLVAVLDGHLYDVDDEAAAVESVATALADGDSDAASEWVASRDGEFVLLVVDPDGERLWALNDQFGRLPLYYATVDGTHLVSRELGFVREFARRTGLAFDVDALAAGQVMLFGYPLGTRSLFEDVELLPPGGCLRVDGDLAVERLCQFDLSGYDHADRSLESNASALRSLFTDACANRAAASETNVISLSGGMDSRAVLAGYAATGNASLAATSVPPTGDSDEGRVAAQVAEQFGVEWTEYVARASDRHRADLLRMAQGMNSLRTAVGLDFCESVVEDYPDATLVTGDGGDKVLPDLTPAGSYDSVDELVSHLVRDYHRLSLADAAAVSGVDRATLRESVASRFADYPEPTLQEKYVHFAVRERGINWLNHGEERTRNYMWSTTPFYSPPFFHYAMNCPPEQKRRYRLYREFLSGFSPDAVGIEYVNFGAPLDSMEYQIKQFGYDLLSKFPELKATVVDLLRDGSKTTPTVATDISELLDATSQSGDPFDRREIQRVVRRGDYTDVELDVLHTVLAAARTRPDVWPRAETRPL